VVSMRLLMLPRGSRDFWGSSRKRAKSKWNGSEAGRGDDGRIPGALNVRIGPPSMQKCLRHILYQ